MRRRLATVLATALVAVALVVSAVRIGAAPAAAATADPYSWKNVQIAGGGFVPGIIFRRSPT